MTPSPGDPRFRVGINYWPAKSAMGFWNAFDPGEVAADFARIAAAGFDSVRLFLLWEHFQPRPDAVARTMLDRLVLTLDCARDAGLDLMPTLFTGHMSGVNFIPAWALGGADGDRRFRVVANGRVTSAGLCNWYADLTIARAQALLAGELGKVTAGHDALWAWDLGNENSNCVQPKGRALGRDWLRRISDAIREADARAAITVGLHMEDLEQDRGLGLAEAAEVCDFLTMHGYPGYAKFARSPTDERLLGFLARLTHWLGGGKPVVFSEFGAPTCRPGEAESEPARAASAIALLDEEEAARYVGRSLEVLWASGCSGAMLWCFADYDPETWSSPPLDLATHERTFGQWRADASPKPAVEVVKSFTSRRLAPTAPGPTPSWIDIAPNEFFSAGSSDLPRLYARYLAAGAR
jgi:endo-1,4-beta-mannosidase